MTVVAFKAIWDIAMLLVVATLTVLLSVGTRELFKFTCWSRVTVSTRLSESIHSWDTHGSVGVLVTVNTVDLYRSMLLTVTHGTERHQVIIIVFSRVVRMKNFMTLLARKTMFATRGFKIFKLSDMTLTTLCGQ